MHVGTKGKHLCYGDRLIVLLPISNPVVLFFPLFLGINIPETKHSCQAWRGSDVSICLEPRLLSQVLVVDGHVCLIRLCIRDCYYVSGTIMFFFYLWYKWL
jgi:hypothetical protein